jgi:hypothetical protein
MRLYLTKNSQKAGLTTLAHNVLLYSCKWNVPESRQPYTPYLRGNMDVLTPFLLGGTQQC